LPTEASWSQHELGTPSITDVILAEFVTAAMLEPIRFAYGRSPTARQDKIREHRAILRCINARDAEGARRAMLASLNDALHNWSGFPARDPEQLSRR